MPRRHHSSSALAVAFCAFGLACSSEGGSPADSAAATATTTPAPTMAMRMRLDDTTGRVSDVQSTPIADGVHIVTGPATTMYNASDTASGNYTVRATFKQVKKPTHPEAYGLFAAGTNLDASAPSYLYFLARGDGKWTVKHRADAATVHTIVDWTANPAVVVEDSAGQATNGLAMVFDADSVRFTVNGTPVHSVARATLESGPGHAGTVGLAGVRVNHNLDVEVTGFRIERR